MEHLEDGDDAEAHAQPQDTAAVGDEPDDGDPLITHNPRDDGTLDVDVEESEVVAGVGEGGGEVSEKRGVGAVSGVKKRALFFLVYDEKVKSFSLESVFDIERTIAKRPIPI